MQRIKKGAKYLSCALLISGTGFIVTALLWPNPILQTEDLPASCATIVTRIGRHQAPPTTDSCSIHHWYYQQLKRIPVQDSRLRNAGFALQERALCAYAIRFQAQMQVREQLPSIWKVFKLRMRDFYVYGSFHGPNFDHLLQGEIYIELTDYYLRLIQKAQDNDPAIDKLCPGANKKAPK